MLERWFPRNEGNLDRVVRSLVGVALLSLTVIGPQTLWGLVGIVPLVTGLVGTCPLYTFFGRSTSSPRHARMR